MHLDNTTKKIEVVLGGAVSANEAQVVASYEDLVLNTTAVAAPSERTRRKVKHMSVYNADTAAITATVQLDDGTDEWTIVAVTLQTTENLVFSDNAGWEIFAADGALKTSAPLTGSAIANTKFLIGGAGGVGAEYALSGDATCTNGGVVTVDNVTVGSDAAGDVPYKASASAYGRLAKGTSRQYMRQNTGLTAPEWASMKTNWLFVLPGTNGEDTDGTATNGAGICGGSGTDIATHMYDDGGGSVYVKCYDHGTTTWDDLSTSALLTHYTANYQLLPDAASEAAGDGFAVGFDNLFGQIAFDDLATGAGALATWGGDGGAWKYWNGSAWASLTVGWDGTDSTANDGLRALQQTGAVSWEIPTDWAQSTIDGQAAYWVKYEITAAQLTQTPLIDATNKDEPMVVIPSEGFLAPMDAQIDAVRLTNLAGTVHNQNIEFYIGAFTSTEPASGASLSLKQTWTASQAMDYFDLSAAKPVIAQGDMLGVLITDDNAAGTNPGPILVEAWVTLI
jgi:hypothetical protein